MRKTVFWYAIAAVALASCSNDETLDLNRGDGISFRTSADKITRGTEITNANIKEFYVTAFDEKGAKYFENLKFTGSENNSYHSDPKYYWPGDNSTLTFRAYAPSKTDIGGTMSFSLLDGDNKLTDFSPKEDVSNQVDLIYATATGNNEQNEVSGVKLTFNHMLSQIEIKAKNSNKGYVYKVKGVRIGKPVSKGTLDFGKAVNDQEKASAWSLINREKTIYTVTYDNEITLDGTPQTIMAKTQDQKSDNAMLLPQQLTAWTPETDGGNTNGDAYLSVLVHIETKDGAVVYPKEKDNEDGPTTQTDAMTPEERYAWAAVAIDTKWEMGNKYTYILDFSNGAGRVDPEEPEEPGEEILGGEIKFTVDVTQWITENNDIDIDMGKDDEENAGSN